MPARRDNLLPQTLETLAGAGFDRPRLFVDGANLTDQIAYDRFGLEITARWPALQVFKSWAMALVELYLREPEADRFAIFQDDVQACRNLRAYLDACPYPDRGYWNLYSFGPTREFGADRARGVGWRCADREPKRGLGALGLVFSREAVLTLFMSRHFVERPIARNADEAKVNWRRVDGAVVDSLNKAGWQEWVHSPSLLQHCGTFSTVVGRNRSPDWVAASFPGVDFDCLSLLR